jgi:hypothetical protein
MSKIPALDLIQNIDRFPDDFLVELKVSRILRSTSEWTDRRNPDLLLPLRQISPGRKAHRLGDIRAKIRGQKPAA